MKKLNKTFKALATAHDKMNESAKQLGLDYSKIDNVEVDGVDTRDYPDFCDSFISYADYDGKEMTDEQLEQLNEDYDYVYDCVIRHLF